VGKDTTEARSVSNLGVNFHHSIVGEEAEDTGYPAELINHNDLARIGSRQHSALGIGIGDLENQVLSIAQGTVFGCVHLVYIKVAYAQSVLNLHN
jgi:hypothetical protein